MTHRNRSQPARFVICIDPGEYSVDLERWKVYSLLPDPDAESHGQFRVVDESGEDYLFPQSYFHPIELPPAIAQRFATSSSS